MCDLSAMSGLRFIFAVLLVLVLLPWGAYSAQMPQAANLQAGLSAEATQTETNLVAPKHCRGPALPGSPCNPVLGLLPEAAAIAGTQGVAHLRASADLAAIRQDLSPPLEPPRPC